MRRLMLVMAVVSALLFAGLQSGAQEASAAGPPGGYAHLADGSLASEFKFDVSGLDPSAPLFVAYQPVGSNTWIQIARQFWTGPDGSTGFSVWPRSDFWNATNGVYKVEACTGTTCIVFTISVGEHTHIFSSSVTGNPCLYPPTYNPALTAGGPHVQFSGNIVLPPAQAYLQALTCGFPAWNYSWAPWDFLDYWAFDYYDYNLWGHSWVWGGYNPAVWTPWMTNQPNWNINPVTMQPWSVGGADPTVLPIISSPTPTIYNGSGAYGQVVAQVLGTQIQYLVGPGGVPLPQLPYYYGR